MNDLVSAAPGTTNRVKLRERYRPIIYSGVTSSRTNSSSWVTSLREQRNQSSSSSKSLLMLRNTSKQYYEAWILTEKTLVTNSHAQWRQCTLPQQVYALARCRYILK